MIEQKTSMSDLKSYKIANKKLQETFAKLSQVIDNTPCSEADKDRLVNIMIKKEDIKGTMFLDLKDFSYDLRSAIFYTKIGANHKVKKCYEEAVLLINNEKVAMMYADIAFFDYKGYSKENPIRDLTKEDISVAKGSRDFLLRCAGITVLSSGDDIVTKYLRSSERLCLMKKDKEDRNLLRNTLYIQRAVLNRARD